jgi:hypothetical protein
VRTQLLFTVTAALCFAAPAAAQSRDTTFEKLQARGQKEMGVDQYTSTHRFDSLPDGGRIELQRTVADPDGVRTIHAHLREIIEEFRKGDFTTPFAVHAHEVPGTRVMAAKKDVIRYEFRELPRGGEVRLTTSDAEALAAIHAFMAFQREDHHAGGKH